MDIFFQLAVLIMSVVIHEVSHGYAAYFQGDHTAEYQGRLTLNPIKHLDPVGSVILPLILVLTHSPFVVGWAKPVPFNPYNLRFRRWGEALVALAGPASNILIALVFGLLIRFDQAQFSAGFLQMSVIIVYTNLFLAIFNLVPVPPLDGSNILFSFLPGQGGNVRIFLEKNSLIFVFMFIFFLSSYIAPVVDIFFRLVTGLT